MKKIIPQALIANAYRIFLHNSFFIISLFLILITASVLFSTIQEAMLESKSIQWSIFSIASQLFTMGLSLGLSNTLMLLIKSKDTSVSQMFEKFDLIFRYLSATIIFSIALIVAMIPGIVIMSLSIDYSNMPTFNPINYLLQNETLDYNFIPISSMSIFSALLMLAGFLYVYLRLQFYQYSILYKNTSAINALKESFLITKDHIVDLSILLVIIILINVLGALLIFGLFISLPISMLAIIMAYFLLVENNE
tara:strand:+ start:387 stop:1139 length:753 start_codon:yes stop_codon:yes gene_type:complete